MRSGSGINARHLDVDSLKSYRFAALSIFILQPEVERPEIGQKAFGLHSPRTRQPLHGVLPGFA